MNRRRKEAWQHIRKSINKKYLLSTHFLGPVANWAIPLSAIMDIYRDPCFISGKMTTALFLYSLMFMRFAWLVQPRNLLLLACHATNASAQNIQLIRFVKANYTHHECDT